MKQATKEFQVDNGTVFEGQVLPDEHPAVDRFPENFTDVKDGDDVEGQAVADLSSGETVQDSPDGAQVDGGKHAEDAKTSSSSSSAKPTPTK